MDRKPYWRCTVKFHFGTLSIEVDRSMPILGGPGIRCSLRIYGKRYWRFKRKIKALREQREKRRRLHEHC